MDTRMEDLVSAFALAVTCEERSPKAWLARRGRFSLQSTLDRMIPEIVLAEGEKRSRASTKIATAAFLKTLQQQCGFKNIRIRRHGLVRDAGHILFRNRRWLRPSNSDDRLLLERNYRTLCATIPRMSKCSMIKFLNVIEDVSSSWNIMLSRIRTPGPGYTFDLKGASDQDCEENDHDECSSTTSATNSENSRSMDLSSLLNPGQSCSAGNKLQMEKPKPVFSSLPDKRSQTSHESTPTAELDGYRVRLQEKVSQSNMLSALSGIYGEILSQEARLPEALQAAAAHTELEALLRTAQPSAWDRASSSHHHLLHAILQSQAGANGPSRLAQTLPSRPTLLHDPAAAQPVPLSLALAAQPVPLSLALAAAQADHVDAGALLLRARQLQMSQAAGDLRCAAAMLGGGIACGDGLGGVSVRDWPMRLGVQASPLLGVGIVPGAERVAPAHLSSPQSYLTAWVASRLSPGV